MITRPQVILKDSTIEDFKRWFRGPDWLLRPSTEWPSSFTAESVADEDPEVVKRKNIFAIRTGPEESFEKFCVKAGSLNQLIRRAAWLKRFPWLHKPGVDYTAPLSLQELEDAERAGVRWIQRVEFREDVEACGAVRRPHSSATFAGSLNA